MVSRVISLASIVCCLLLLISFGLFAYNQASGADKRQIAELTGISTTSSGRADRNQPRKFIDGAAHAMTSPLRDLMRSSNSPWAIELVSTLGGLLVYGLALGFLGRYAKT